MPHHCCVPGCRGNYKNGPKVKVFQFPNNPDLTKQWLKAINREDFTPTIYTKVCIKHFKPEDIITETSAFDSKRNITITAPLRNYRLQPSAIPSVFDDCTAKTRKAKKRPIKDNQLVEEKDSSKTSVGSNMQIKNIKSPGASTSDIEPLSSPCKSEDEGKRSKKSPKKVSPTTDRPIIAVIKAQDLGDDKSPEKTNEDSDSAAEQSNATNNDSFSLPSPYKNLPSVSVCLKEEDRVPISRELKGIKRSPSTGSNSSNGSADVQKPVVKRRKVEKPAPVVIGRQNDAYCWVCHRENIVLSCIACPRAYHSKCAGEMSGVTPDWVCPECQRILAAENVDTRSSTLADISLDRLGALLKLSLNKMKQRAPIAFHQAVSLEHYPLYLHYVIHPMDFTLLEKNIKQQVYGCTEAFLSDVKWIAHNSCVFNGTQHPLSTNAKNLVKVCDQDMQEIEVCPDCFVHSIVRNKYWFSEVCRKPHPLVWAKLKGFPYWPAKVVRILDGNVDARFFGAHDRAWVPVNQCYHLSKEMPTTSKPKKKGNYEIALDELNVHVHLIIQKFGNFEYAPYRTHFSPTNKYLMYHGIDISKAAKDDSTFDTAVASPSKIRFPSPEKESRFNRMMETESEQCNNSEDIQQEEKLDSSSSKVLQLNDKTSSFINGTLLFNEKKSDECSEADKDMIVKNTTNIEEKKNDKAGDSVASSSDKKSGTNSDSDQLDQLRKLELALERIKGYVSVGVDSEKENEENTEVEEKKDEVENKSPSKADDNTEKKESNFLSPLFKKTIKLPDIEPNVPETTEIVNVTLETTKKTDSFFLKLNETIESCKAKLGISEITDDIPSDNESVGDENVSKSDDDDDDDDEEEEDDDEDNEENSSASDEENGSLSECDEENSSVNEEDAEDENEISEDENEVEHVEATDNENEDSSDCKIVDKPKKGESADSESGDNSNSDLSDTDVEASDNDASSKTHDKSDVRKNPDYEDSVKDLYSDNHDSSNDIDMDISENVINSANRETSEENSSNHVVDDKISSGTNNLNESESSVLILESRQMVSPKQNEHPLDSLQKADETSINFFTDQKTNRPNSIDINDSPSKNHISAPSNVRSSANEQQQVNSEKPQSEEKSTESAACKMDEEDDDIYICNSPIKKTPPVIVLDDEDNEENSVSDTCAIRTPPYSTSAESFSNEENPAFKPSNDDNDPSLLEKSVITNGSDMRETLSEDSKPELMKKLKFSNIENEISSSVERAKKRLLFSPADNSDDEIQVLRPEHKSARTGAIRTVKKRNNENNAYSNSISQNSIPESETGSLMNNVATPEFEVPANADKNNDEVLNSRQMFSPSILQSPVFDPGQFSDKDKQILFLTKKLNCVVTAYRFQVWKNAQEKEELRHNMNLVMMEMRQCFESDKKQAIERLSQKFEQEKRQIIEETKKKQWCASCHMESRYACCWNTSYCSITCQKRHFPEHRKSCSQVKKRANNEMPEVKQKPVPLSTNDGIENNKKIVILNMKPPDITKSSSNIPASINTQPVIVSPSCKPQIQVLSPKPQTQLASAVSTPNSIQPVQFFVSQEKPQSTMTPSVNVANKELDSSSIISGVRSKTCDLNTAICLIKKKNLESTVTFLKKNEENKQNKKEKKGEQKDETNLEERYFPSPPTITFEDYDSVSPEPNLVIEEPSEDGKMNPEDMDIDAENYEGVNPETDIVLSDSDDVNNEMVNIGRGTEVKAKYLNRCLVYGITAKKLTRSLVDVIFTDIKLLASCSAFGQKSNVTKLTRCALPARKVYSIIDFVSRRFPGTSRSEIVHAINMKCKEARVIVSKEEHTRKLMTLKAVIKEKESDPAVNTPPPTPSLITPTPILPKTVPNLVCVKSSNDSQVSLAPSYLLPKKSVSSPNILRCTPQLLIRPKPVLNTLGTAAFVRTPQISMPTKKRETVRNLLAKKMNWPAGNVKNEGTKFLMTLDTLKTSTSNIQQPVSDVSSSTASPRPLIIIGSHVNTLKAATQVAPMQHPALPASSPAKK